MAKKRKRNGSKRPRNGATLIKALLNGKDGEGNLHGKLCIIANERCDTPERLIYEILEGQINRRFNKIIKASSPKPKGKSELEKKIEHELLVHYRTTEKDDWSFTLKNH